MEGVPHPVPRTVEEVFTDFKGRRSGLIKALTTGTLLSFSPFSIVLFVSLIVTCLYYVYTVFFLLLQTLKSFTSSAILVGLGFLQLMSFFLSFR